MKTFLTASIIAVVVLASAGAAEAQRGRRRARPPAPTVQPPEPVPESEPSPDASTDATTPVDDAGTPPAQSFSQPPVAEPPAVQAPAVADLGPLQTDFAAVMDELVQARSRVAVLGRELFQTRIRVSIQNRAGDDNALANASLRLDGAPIYHVEGSELGEDERQAFEGFAAPGPHVITVEIEQRQREDDNYRYTLRDTYRFEVIRGKLTEVVIVLDDDSEIAEDFADDEEGEFDVRTRVRVATRELGE